jgi:hypothetical protein
VTGSPFGEDFLPLPEPSAELGEAWDEYVAFANGERRQRGAHAILTLWRFGNWATRHLTPGLEWFGGLMEPVGCRISLLLRAELTLRPQPSRPWHTLVGAVGMGMLLLMPWRRAA